MDKKTTPTILLVDDDKQILKSSKMWLSGEGFNVLTAANKAEALKIVIDEPVEVALVDFRIGQEDGITVAQKLNEVDESLKIIIFTGFPSYETAVESMKIGAFDYLSKSSPSEKIVDALKKAIAHRQEERVNKEKSGPDEKRVKMILSCHHSLIKERLENYSRKSSEFKLVKTYPRIDALHRKDVAPNIKIALICASCNIENFSDCYTLFPHLYHTYPGVKPIIINENFSDQEKVELLKLGVRGFCVEDSGCETLEKVISHISRGELWVSRQVTQLSLKEMIDSNLITPAKKRKSKNPRKSDSIKKENKSFGLTSKEKEILDKISHGAKNKEIADELSISEATVKTHINRILKKLHVDNRTKASLVAMEQKII